MLDKTALIIDDSPTARTMLKHKLAKFDVVVETAADGFEALQLLHDHLPDVIFLDHIMPGMDGFEVLQTLKDSPVTQTIPVVMYTSQAAPRYSKEARALGAVGVMPKQITNDLLSSMLDKAEQYHYEVAADKPAVVETSAEELSPAPLDEGAEHLSETVATAMVVDSQTPARGSFRSSLAFLLMFLLVLSQGFWLLKDHHNQQAIGQLQQQLNALQDNHQQVAQAMVAQRELQVAALEELQFVMDVLVSQALEKPAETDLKEIQPGAIDQLNQPASPGSSQSIAAID